MTINNKIAKLIYQSKHRGCKENDILLGRFANKISTLSLLECQTYEYFLNEEDSDIYQWLCNAIPCPDKYIKIIQKIQQC